MFGLDIRARIEHQSSIDVFRGARRATAAAARRHRASARSTPATSSRDAAGRSPSATPRTCSRTSSAWRSVLDADEGSVCYSGDSGLCEEIVELARGCDVLIQMNHHYSGTEPSAGVPRGLRQPPRQRHHRRARRREDAGAHAPAPRDRSSRDPRDDRSRDPSGVRRRGDLGRGPDGDRIRSTVSRTRKGQTDTRSSRRATKIHEDSLGEDFE